MLLKTRGIVLRCVKYGESSVIADIYTEAKGLRSYIAGGVRTPKSKMSAGLFQPGALVEVLVYERPDAALNRLREIRADYVFSQIPFDVKRGTIALFMAEVAARTLREPEENKPLFEFLYECLTCLDQTEHPLGNLPIYYLVSLAGYLGFLPGGTFSEETPYFDLRAGRFSGDPEGHPYLLDAAHSQALDFFLHTDLDAFHEHTLPRAIRQSLLDQLLQYYRLHIEHLPAIHTHEVLREVF